MRNQIHYRQLDRSASFVFSCYNKNKNYQMSYPLCYYSNRPASGGPPPSQQMSGRQSPWRICCLEIPRKSVFQSPHRYQTSGLYCESVKHYCQQSALPRILHRIWLFARYYVISTDLCTIIQLLCVQTS